MRSLAGLFRARDQVQRYAARGLAPGRDGAVFGELHIGRSERPVDVRTTNAVRRFLAGVFRPAQPQIDQER